MAVRRSVTIILIALGPLGACEPREYDRSFDLGRTAPRSHPQILPLGAILPAEDAIQVGPPPLANELDAQNDALTSRAATLPSAGGATDDLARRADGLQTRAEALRERQ